MIRQTFIGLKAKLQITSRLMMSKLRQIKLQKTFVKSTPLLQHRVADNVFVVKINCVLVLIRLVGSRNRPKLHKLWVSLLHRHLLMDVCLLLIG